MTDPQKLSIKDFTYSLPEDRIAKYPLAERDASKLLLYRNGKITQDIFRNLESHLPENSLLVFNDTKVVEARLLFQKPTGGVIEIFCLEPHSTYPDITSAMLQHEKVLWQCLIGGASKWKHGQLLEKKITIGKREIILSAKYLEKLRDSFVVELSWNEPSLSFAEVLHLAGVIPLPPYIKRDAELADADRYQTVYAQYDGSVAAPTAGLHFTTEVFEKLRSKNIQTNFVTLHVGAGTFKPVKSATMQEHHMHAEYISVSKSAIENIIRQSGRNIIAVGTTSVRTIESLYWLGLKLSIGNSQLATGNESLMPNLDQWECYDLAKSKVPVKDALENLLDWMNEHDQQNLLAKTRIIIAPGYKPCIANGLITNFHLPQSTLLLLIAAMIGDQWKKVYDYALENDFRFLSYGDSSLLWFD